MKTLLHVALLHHADNVTAREAADTLRRAFGPDRSFVRQVGGLAPGGVWDSVRVVSMSSKTEVAAFQPSPDDRVLWILMVDYEMTLGLDWPVILEEVALRLAEDGIDAEQRCQVLVFGSDEAVVRLPDKLKERQALGNSALGENRLRPHTLALLALHRARLLLDRRSEQTPLKLFISHAKADGIFFAQALSAAIKGVVELQGWYDADDINSGSKWRKILKDSASNNILIALRTEAYTESRYCREEFECALEHGVPIVVVDALMHPETSPSPLPFAAMPTVRIPDGNTHRVLVAALREHLRLSLVETQIADEYEALPRGATPPAWSVWPRLPAYQVIQNIMFQRANQAPHCLIIAETPGAEFMAACALLDRIGASLRLATPDRLVNFAPFMPQLPVPDPLPPAGI